MTTTLRLGNPAESTRHPKSHTTHTQCLQVCSEEEGDAALDFAAERLLVEFRRQIEKQVARENKGLSAEARAAKVEEQLANLPCEVGCAEAVLFKCCVACAGAQSSLWWWRSGSPRSSASCAALRQLFLCVAQKPKHTRCGGGAARRRALTLPLPPHSRRWR